MTEGNTMSDKAKELYLKIPSELNNKDLSSYIQEVKEFRIKETNCSLLSANECNTLLSLAVSEQNGRNSLRLAKTAIFISVLGILADVLLVALKR
jgi:hypothetical protein